MIKTKEASQEIKGWNGVFATRFRALLGQKQMNGKSLTQQNLADYLHAKRQTISQYADGSILPNAEKICLIAKFFNVSIDYLMGLVDIQSVDICDKKISQLIGLKDEAIKNLRTSNEDNKNNAQAVNILLNENNGGLRVLNSILSYLNFDKMTYSAIPNDLIDAYNGKTYTIDGEKMELILLTQVQDKLRQLKHNKEV